MASQDAETNDTPDQNLENQEESKPLSLEVQVSTPSACQRHVTVKIPREDIERYMSKAIDDLAPKAQVPGFRAGRAPRGLVEKRFRSEVADQVKGSLLMDSMTQVTEEHKFAAISEPQFDVKAIELPEEGPMTFEFDLEVRPEFDVPQWRGLQLERLVHNYTDEEVDRQLKIFLAKYGHFHIVEEPATADDHLALKIICRDGDQVVSESEEPEVQIRPVISFRDAKVEGFDTLMSGVRAGDRREAVVRVSDDAFRESLRGKEVTVVFEVLAVKRMHLPNLTPSFLDRIGGFEDEDALRNAVREELERQLQYYQQQQIRRQITGYLTQNANWELPPDLLRRQARRELERSVLELRASGFSDADIREHQNDLLQNSKRSTERALKEHFILERIAEDLKIDAETADYEREVRAIAAQSGDTPRRVRARLEKRGQWDTLRNQIVERKVIDVITEAAMFHDSPFQLSPKDTVAIDRSLSGEDEDASIPEAQHADAEGLRQPVAHG